MRTSRLHLVAGGVPILLCDGDLIKPFSGSDPSHQTSGELSTSSELRDSTSLYRVPGAAAWPGLAAAGAKFKI